MSEILNEGDICPKCRCCSLVADECSNCGGEGGTNRYELDPLAFAEDDWLQCDWCDGEGNELTCGGCCREDIAAEEN